jgi:hypothetical protein
MQFELYVAWIFFLAQTFSCPTSEGFYPIPGKQIELSLKRTNIYLCLYV